MVKRNTRQNVKGETVSKTTIFREFKSREEEKIIKLMFALNKEDSQELPLSKRKIEQLFLHAPQKKYVQIFVAEKNKEIIGYAVFNKAFSIEFEGIYGEIDEIYIKPDYRNQGIGTKFIKWVERLSKKNKFNALFLVATIKNKKSQKLYKRLGFKPLPQIGFIKIFRNSNK